MTPAPSGLDLSPRPGSATRAAMLRAQTTMELRLQLRNAEQVLLTMVIPLVLLVLGSQADQIVDLGPGRTIDIITPGILALAVLSTSFTSLAIATGFERRYGIIKRLGASPLPRWGLLFGKIGAVVIIEVAQLAVLSGVGLALGWQPHGQHSQLKLGLLEPFGLEQAESEQAALELFGLELVGLPLPDSFALELLALPQLPG